MADDIKTLTGDQLDALADKHGLHPNMVREFAAEVAEAAVLADREGRQPVGTLECHASGTATFWPDDAAVLALPVGDYAVYLAPDAQRAKGDA